MNKSCHSSFLAHQEVLAEVPSTQRYELPFVPSSYRAFLPLPSRVSVTSLTGFNQSRLISVSSTTILYLPIPVLVESHTSTLSGSRNDPENKFSHFALGLWRVFQIGLGIVLGTLVGLQLAPKSVHYAYPGLNSIRLANLSLEPLVATAPETQAQASVPSSIPLKSLEGTLINPFASTQSSVQPSPIVVDRFYMPAPGTTASLPTGPFHAGTAMVVVDRFYLPGQPSVEQAATLPQFLPPASSDSNRSALPPVSEATPTAPQGTSDASSPNPPGPLAVNSIPSRSSYKLLGVVEFGKRSTALFQHGESTYSIRVGESVGTTDWVLTSLTNSKAILTNTRETLQLAVGDEL